MNMTPSPDDAHWARLQTELRDLALILDREGSHAAADAASFVAARIDELVTGEMVARSADIGTHARTANGRG